MIDWSHIPDLAVQAFFYGFFGAIAGGLVTWLAGRHLFAKPWRELVVLVRQHTAATREHTQALQAQTEQLARLAGPPQRREET